MLPIGDDNSARRIFPVVTYALIAVNVVVFLTELGQPDPQRYIAEWGAVPSQISAGRSLATLVTSTFLHAGWAHLLGNMLFLFIFGDNVEDAFGHLKYLAFYMACGVLAGLAQVYLAASSNLPGVGASGAISYGAHVGGFLGGLVLAFLLRPTRRRPVRRYYGEPW